MSDHRELWPEYTLFCGVDDLLFGFLKSGDVHEVHQLKLSKDGEPLHRRIGSVVRVPSTGDTISAESWKGLDGSWKENSGDA